MTDFSVMFISEWYETIYSPVSFDRIHFNTGSRSLRNHGTLLLEKGETTANCSDPISKTFYQTLRFFRQLIFRLSWLVFHVAHFRIVMRRL